MNAYLIIDVGTGNLRVAVCTAKGDVLALQRKDIRYYNDTKYPDAQYFNPDNVWKDIIDLSKEVLSVAKKDNKDLTIVAGTSTSQREGVVLIDIDGNDIIGLPNHDHRGREWESTITNPDEVYKKTGRKVSSLFSALKVKGFLNRYPEYEDTLAKFTSISDWVTYKLSGSMVYEHSQASETNLYDVQNKKWNEALCESFGIPISILPPLAYAGKELGSILPEISAEWKIEEVKVLVGGADTQMAINSTAPELNDLVIVAGTTTPIVKVKDVYTLDDRQRTWTNSHLFNYQYILEVNAGVTGLNLQRLKQFFYPKEPYEVMEKELNGLSLSSASTTIASLGSLICAEPNPLTIGGFVFKTPVNHELTRADFVLSAIIDMAFSIHENLKVLLEIDNNDTDFLWICGGGAQGRVFMQILANVLKMKLRIRTGFEQASVNGAVKLCNKALGIESDQTHNDYEEINWQDSPEIDLLYKKWKAVRQQFRALQENE